MSLIRITDATAEPVSLEDFKLWIGEPSTETDRDALITRLLKTARKECENKTQRLCLPQTWKMTIDTFADPIRIPLVPLSTDSANVVITYLDPTSGNSTTLASTYYTVDANKEPGLIHLAYNSDWPDHYDMPSAVTVQFVAGHKLTTGIPSTDTCPENMETWILLRAAGLMENRESISERPVNEMPRTFFDGLLDDSVIIDVRPPG